jgi:hypothetical protein
VRYLITVIDHTANSATPDEMVTIDRFNDGLREGGHWVMACGLAAPDTATVVDNRSGSPEIVDGPLHRTEEYPSGFWIVEAPDRDVALQLASDGSLACNRRVELRPLLGP